MWKEELKQLKKSFEFSAFVDAFTFMTKAAMLAPQMKHKSFYYGNVHLVTIILPSLNEDEGIGQTEIEIASEIDSMYSRMNKLR
ncbi:MAG: 4a-hydroxytetrahydrobiopterin dehydratase [Bacteroidota bacterium]